MKKITVSIVGATGYTGNELLRILKAHPRVEIDKLISSSKAGKKISEICPHLQGVYEQKLESFSEKVFASDLVFFALPHGKSSALIKKLPLSSKIIDLAGDFRISDKQIFEKFYGVQHSPLQKKFTYGLVEKNRDKIKKSNYIANPGCFAIAIELALLPFAKAASQFLINGFTGSSGSGKNAKEATHHPTRLQNIKSYKLNTHQHTPEIIESLEIKEENFCFIPHSIPIARGIFISAIIDFQEALKEKEMKELAQNQYGKEKQVRIVDSAQTINVKGTNFTDFSYKIISPKKILVNTAIDNLVKGAAGNAVQNMNLIFNFPEDEGLDNLSPVFP